MPKTKDYDIGELIFFKQTNPGQYLKVNPVLRSLVDGICDENCVLFMLNGIPHILLMIWDLITQYWESLILLGREEEYVKFYEVDDECYFFQLESDFQFPEPKDICINMMPFHMEETFTECKLPDYLEPYWTQIIDHTYFDGHDYRGLIPDSEIGKIGFLTIHESHVEEGKTQRTGGIHIESTGMLNILKCEDGSYVCAGNVSNNESLTVVNNVDQNDGTIGSGCMIKINISWGIGAGYKNEFVGGVYMASNVSNSCAVWNCKILADENGDEIIGSLGDLEHLREFLPVGEKMEANKMYWLTDRTPHEALPLKAGTYRQYFRLVTSEVSVWFEEHSTKNPLGVEPDPKITTIVKGSKFGNTISSYTDCRFNPKQS